MELNDNDIYILAKNYVVGFKLALNAGLEDYLDDDYILFEKCNQLVIQYESK